MHVNFSTPMHRGTQYRAHSMLKRLFPAPVDAGRSAPTLELRLAVQHGSARAFVSRVVHGRHHRDRDHSVGRARCEGEFRPVQATSTPFGPLHGLAGTSFARTATSVSRTRSWELRSTTESFAPRTLFWRRQRMKMRATFARALVEYDLLIM